MGRALYRPELTLFHVKHGIWLAEKAGFGGQGSHDQLALEAADLRYETAQAGAVQLGSGIVQEQGWKGAGQLSNEVELGEGHRGGDQLLLAPGQRLAGKPLLQPDHDVSAVSASVGDAAGDVTVAAGSERFGQSG